MTEEQIALGRRAVACKGFRWMGGMKVVDGFRVAESVVPMMFPVDTPDLTDPATLGCLLALVREAWGDPTIVTAATLESDDSRCWITDCWNPHSPVSALITCPTEAHALVAALEAAP